MITQLKKEKILARKAKNNVKVEAINYVLSMVEVIELRNNKTLSDDEVSSTIKKAVAELEETRDMYIGANRVDSAKDATDKINILTEYLPTMLTDEQTELAVEQAILFHGASSIKDMGKVMGSLKKDFGTMIDMSIVSSLVKKKLS